MDCAGQSPDNAVCVAGGLNRQGDEGLAGITDAVTDPLPVRVVELSPFFLDQVEYTVGRYRRHLQQQGAPEVAPRDQSWDPLCTLQNVDNGSNDGLPLNCVTWQTARELCQAAGGDLPTEAQWEHAARGRGEFRDFPWGDAQPACCTAAVSRYTPIGNVSCAAEPPLPPAGSFRDVGDCPTPGDVSRDGVLDRGGSLIELTLDAFEPYSGSECWATEGVAVDPWCDIESNLRTSRGGSFVDGRQRALGALRNDVTLTLVGIFMGFRCAYPGGVEP